MKSYTWERRQMLLKNGNLGNMDTWVYVHKVILYPHEELVCLRKDWFGGFLLAPYAPLSRGIHCSGGTDFVG